MNINSKKSLLFVFGTRPEGIKLAPLIREFEKFPDLFDVKICVTGQHREMLRQVLSFFGIVPDYNLNVMKANQHLSELTAEILLFLKQVLEDVSPDVIFVQGDTTTAFAAALAGFYQKIDVAHVEAGLRSGDFFSPFPEERNRILIGHIAKYHFVPTVHARANLRKEGILENVFLTGNTVIDALSDALKMMSMDDNVYRQYFHFLDLKEKRVLLLTVHRRESFGAPLERICKAVLELVEKHRDIEVVCPVHPNPGVKEPIYRILMGFPGVHLIEPLDYPHLIWLMNRSYLILSDSGGIQEEASFLGKPVLVLRELSDRGEAIKAGTAVLVGTDRKKIVSEAGRLLNERESYVKMAQVVDLYGSGNAAAQIVRELIGEWEAVSKRN
ncbi:MAG: UDP-N-acetylglucosamine 2-epimerase (non-hydrolyzing) [Acidobacteria bacterium]|nr:UDP-N-acetylglucosamine 2-epimerase (non-hydrolyzing) [Acidobacteriota bacterium]